MLQDKFDANKQDDISHLLLKNDDATVLTLLKAGVHFGHKTQKWHPSMKKYIYTESKGIHIIDLVKTIEKFNEAAKALFKYSSSGLVIFVGTKPQAKDIVKAAAIRSKSFFVVHRWPGGLLTNMSMTIKSIKKLSELLSSFRFGIENRTKKELLLMKTELQRLFNLYGGLRGLNKKPSCLVVVDAKKSRIAIREANKIGIPVIAMVDTNSSTEMIDHVIPSNDDAIGSIELIINRLADVVLLANKGRGAEYEDVNMNEITELINNMAKTIELRKKSMLKEDTALVKNGYRKPKVIRVTREQVKKVVKI